MTKYNEDITIKSLVKDLQRRVRTLETTTRLPNSSIDSGNLTVNGGVVKSGDFDGTDVSHPGTTGWQIGGPSGDAIFNTLTLRNGIIGDDALTNPIRISQGNNGIAGFTCNTSSTTNRTGFNVPVPAGFTQMACFTAATAFVINQQTVPDYASITITINQFSSDNFPSGITGGNNGSTRMTITKQGLLTGLNGGDNIAVNCQVWGQGGSWGISSVNFAGVNGIFFFLR